MFSQCHTQITLLHYGYCYCVFVQHSSCISFIRDNCIISILPFLSLLLAVKHESSYGEHYQCSHCVWDVLYS